MIENIQQLIVILGIPTGIVSSVIGLCFWYLQRKITEREDEKAKEREERKRIDDERDKQRKELELQMFEGITACITLSTATAKAVQRIPDAHCNGDMHSALEEVQKVQEKHAKFMEKLALEHVM